MRTIRLATILWVLATGLFAEPPAINPEVEVPEQTVAEPLTGVVETELPAWQDHVAAKMLDGDPESAFWVGRNIRKGDHVTVNLADAVPAGKVIVAHTGFADGRDSFRGAVLEASSDGDDWWEIGTVRCGVLAGSPTGDTRHLRIRATKDLPHWVAIRELEVVKESPVKVTRGEVVRDGEKIPLSLACRLEGFEDLAPEVERISSAYFRCWGRLVDMLGVPIDGSARDIDLLFKPGMNHPAHASGRTIVISPEHLKRNPDDSIGVFIHELTHVIQRYPSGNPGWFVEGSADYTRFLLNPDDRWARHNQKHVPHQKPFGGYWASAAFLFYLEDAHGKSIVRPVSAAIRAGRYDEKIWSRLTGKDLKTLAKDYKESKWSPPEKTEN